MTVRQIQELVASVDPMARHYRNTKDGSDYTVWMEYKRMGLSGDDSKGKGWKFEIDRYTKEEYDPMADAIEEALVKDERVAFSYDVVYEQDTGYIRHLFDCEGY